MFLLMLTFFSCLGGLSVYSIRGKDAAARTAEIEG